MGFGAPLAQWLRGPLRELASDMLLSSGCAQRGWLEPKAVRDLITEHMTGAANPRIPAVGRADAGTLG